jgi:hypothetical protein
MHIAEVFFGVTMGLISIGATVIILMLIVRAVQHRQTSRERMFMAALEKGVYDPKIMYRGNVGTGAASLGWGIFFAMVGVALLIGFAILGIIGEAALGGLIPLAIGVGLIAFHVIMKRNQKDIEHNGDPIRFEPKVAPPTGSTRNDHGNLGG